MSIKSAENYQKKSMENFEEFENDIININSGFSDLELTTLKSEVSNKNKEIDDYNKYPYINEQDYQKYFAPETFNFKQFGIGSCRFLSAIYGITHMESYKAYIKNSVKKDENGNFIIKLPLSEDKKNEGVWYKPNLSVYQNQRTIDGSNPQVLHKEKKDENQDNGNGIIALSMAIGEKITGRTNFDIYRLESGTANEVFSNGKSIKGISLEEVVEPDIDNGGLIDIDKLKSILGQNNTIVTASVKENNDGSFETISGNNRSESNHEITITKIIKEGNVEYVQYYDPNFSELKKLTVNDFQQRCYKYFVFCETDKDDKYRIPDREKPYQDVENKNSPGIIVEKTGKPNKTLRNLRGDFITYKEDDKIIVESFGKRSEIINGMPPLRYKMTLSTTEGEIIGQDSGDLIDDEEPKKQKFNPFRSINFPDSNVRLYIDTNNLSEKHKGEKNDKYDEYLYLPKIANFMNRMIHDYIDTEAWNKENTSPFSINAIGDLVFDDDPYNFNLDKIENSERTNMEAEWRERRKEKDKPWNHKLVCLRHRKNLGIDDMDTKKSIINALNNIVKERINNK